VADPGFIEKTIKVWQPRSREKFTHEDARVIIQNMTDYLELLMEWERTEISPSEEGEANCGSNVQ
jgi:hypothetical protein